MSFSDPFIEPDDNLVCQREGCWELTHGAPFCTEHASEFVGVDKPDDPKDVECHYNDCANLSLFGETRCIDHRFTGVLDLRSHTYATCDWFEDDDYCGRDATTRASTEDPWRCDEHPFEREVEPAKDFEICTYPGCTLHGDQVIYGVRWCMSHRPSDDNPALFADATPAPSVYTANGVYIAWYTASVTDVLDALKVELGRLHDDETDEKGKAELGKTLFILSEAQATLKAWRK